MRNAELYSDDALWSAARLAHEANRGLQCAFGEQVSEKWEDCPDWQRRCCRLGVEAIASRPAITPAEQHACWLKNKERNGWRFGPEKDAERKEHPCMVPYDALPQAQRLKDYVFGAVVRAVLSIREG